MAQSFTGSPANMFYLNTSPPDHITETRWMRWLSTQFIPALLESNIVIRASVYREVGFAMIPNPTHPLRYVVLCQTDFHYLQDSEKYKQAYERTGASKYLAEGQSVEIRNYGLIQDYNPNAVHLKPAPNMLSVEMDPEDPIDFEDWYRKDLLPKLSTLKGYIRSRRYEVNGTANNTISPYLALHGIQHLSKAFVSQKAHEEASTPRMEKHIEASDKPKTEKGGGFIKRGWELVYAEGYQMESTTQDAQAIGGKVGHEAVISSNWTWLRRLLVGVTSLRCRENSTDRFEPVFL